MSHKQLIEALKQEKIQLKEINRITINDCGQYYEIYLEEDTFEKDWNNPVIDTSNGMTYPGVKNVVECQIIVFEKRCDNK